MTEKLNIFVGEMLAGKLQREGAQYTFEYDSSYQGPPVFLGWDRAQSRREWNTFPAAFDSLLPEGVLLDQLLIKYKLDRSDKWGQLIAVGLDLTGFVSVIPEDSDQKPIGKVTPGQPAKKRVAIDPNEKGVLPYTATELVAYHGKHRMKMSLSGMQPKVSAIFSRKDGQFRVVDTNGSYILKPSPQAFPGAAENEALTMELAHQAGIDVPLCGWISAKDGSGVFWIERFDRWGAGNRQRVRCEDACQVLDLPASWKYLGNLETLAKMIEAHCSNPRLQLVRFFQRVLFCWVTGNGDMHLKNWSLLENGKLIELAPAYDLLNTRILTNDEEESALELDDKKTGFDRALLIDYFGRDICGLNDRMIEKTTQALRSVNWDLTIHGSKLSVDDSIQFQQVVYERLERLGLK
ncbi:MAG: type II toxin-antitoxin system HipA family toxin [Opitutales bacterium]